MPTKSEHRLGREVIDDIVDKPTNPFTSHSTLALDYTNTNNNSLSKTLPSSLNSLNQRTYSSFTNLPSMYKSATNLLTSSTTTELRDRLHLTLPRSSSSTTASIQQQSLSNDERRKELEMIIRSLYEKTDTNNDEQQQFNGNLDSHFSMKSTNQDQTLNSNNWTSTFTNNNNGEDKLNNANEIITLEDLNEHSSSNGSLLQRELKEKELDIVHLQKELQEVQLENKLIKAKLPGVSYQNGTNKTDDEVEAETLRREKDILENELKKSHELIAKLQQSPIQKTPVYSKIDEITLHQKETLEKKLKLYERQLTILTQENEKYNQHFYQTDRTIQQLKRENEELQQKVSEVKKRNEEILYQEFNTLRSDLKMLKQRNDELFEENRRLQLEQRNANYRTTYRPPSPSSYNNGNINNPNLYNQVSASENVVPPPSTYSRSKPPPPSVTQRLSANDRRKDANGLESSNYQAKSSNLRSDSPTSETSDSTQYLTSISVERYTRPHSNRPQNSREQKYDQIPISRYPNRLSIEELQSTDISNNKNNGAKRIVKKNRSVEWNNVPNDDNNSEDPYRYALVRYI
ncbi:unnamed protein product, partial [Didymodactylos carnosus]